MMTIERIPRNFLVSPFFFFFVLFQNGLWSPCEKVSSEEIMFRSFVRSKKKRTFLFFVVEDMTLHTCFVVEPNNKNEKRRRTISQTFNKTAFRFYPPNEVVWGDVNL